MFPVRGLIAPTMNIPKHRLAGLKRPRYIYANNRGLCFMENFQDSFDKSQLRFKVFDQKFEETMAHVKETMEDFRKKRQIWEDWKLTMQPLQPTAIALLYHFFTNYRKCKAGKPVDGDKNVIDIGNHDAQGGDIMADVVMISHGHIDDTHTFHELYGITHDTAKPYLGIYSSPLHLVYVY